MPPATDRAPAAACDAAATKRIKKREVDRRCQREARQRTKSRVAYLEGLVDELRHKDTSGQVGSLLKQVARVRKERDTYARTLQSIEESIRRSSVLLGGAPAKQEPTSSPTLGLRDSSDDSGDPGLARNQGMDAAATSINTGDSKACPDLACVAGSDPAQHGGPPSPRCVEQPQADASLDGGRCECSEPLPSHKAPDVSSIDMRGRDMWRFAHKVLDAPRTLPPRILRWEEEQCQDAPVRAVVEGWPAVAARLGGQLPPLWSKLRRIDEVVFCNLGKVERLAALRIMHLLLLYHADPASNKSKIPAWYLARPSQNISHSYALDFFTWPGVRERFIFSQHSYCSNKFWYLHNASLKVLWQYDFRDCFTVNLRKGVYQISQAFDERITDLNAWTMGPAIFQNWPEFYGDMPSHGTITAPMDTIWSPQIMEFSSREPLHALPFAKTRSIMEVRDGETTSIPAHSHSPSSPGEEHRGSVESLFEDVPTVLPPEHASPVQQRRLLGEFMHEEGTGDDVMFPMVPEEGAFPTLPTSLSKIWDVRSSDTIPEHDWVWLIDGLDGKDSEMT